MSVIEDDLHQPTSELAGELGCDCTTVSNLLHIMRKVSKLDKWVPYKLSEAEKIQRATISASSLSRQKEEPMLGQIITSDEKWILWNNQRGSHSRLDSFMNLQTNAKTRHRHKEVSFVNLVCPIQRSSL